ncbi:MAG: prepilin-type N-terminal cleavage/methylation domain-containing protein [Deltaproteobacteria bacterium]|nr:prepilin-type N-terminal cleavage/methylation domain-containing protein [Deltaproteobacteria bacterium]
MKTEVLGNHEGFTLLEVIVTLIITSILGAMLVSMMGGVFTRSTQPAIQTMEVHAMNQVADSISRAYRELGSISDLQTNITGGLFDVTASGIGISVTAGATGYGSGGTPVEGSSSDLLKVTITGSSGLTYALLFGSIEI